MITENDKLKLIYETTINLISKNEFIWKDYLKFTSKIYKYSFTESLLIFAQNSNVTAVATKDIWNKVGSKISNNENSICVFDDTSTVKHLYDVSQTDGAYIPQIWSLDNYRDDKKIVEFIDNIDTYINDCVNVNKPIYSLQNNKNDDIIKKSIEFLIYYRMNIDTNYNDISDINTIRDMYTISNIAGIVIDTSKTILSNIDSLIKEIEEERGFKNDRTNKENVDRNNGRTENEKSIGESKEWRNREESTTNRSFWTNGKAISNGQLSIENKRIRDINETTIQVSRDTRRSLKQNSDIRRKIIGTKSSTNYKRLYSKIKTLSLLQQLSRRNSNKRIYRELPLNYRYNEDDNLYSGTKKDKFKANIKAIKLLNELQNSNRNATEEEQVILANYMGWGGLSEVFSPTSKNWDNEYKELKSLLNDDEYKSAINSTITSFFTEQYIVKSIYKALKNSGFNGNKNQKLLDPSMGTGNFFSVLPNEFADIHSVGVELDFITGRIAKYLYPNSDINICGFENFNCEDNTFDVAVGNIPFSNIRVSDKRYNKHNFLIHDYFISKTVDLVKKGGIIAYITSKGTMDKKNNSTREYLAKRVELVGAIRLPSKTFKSAGTETTSDILFFKKREQELGIDETLPTWINTVNIETLSQPINQYFVDNPNMIIGEMQDTTNQFGMDSTCVYTGNDINHKLDSAIDNLSFPIALEKESNHNIYDIDLGDELIEKEIQIDSNIKNFTYGVLNDTVYYNDNMDYQKCNFNDTRLKRIKWLCNVREVVLEIINIQTNEYKEEDLNFLQYKLNTVYDRFIKKFGFINSNANKSALKDDIGYYLLCSIEDETEQKGVFKKSNIFSEPTIKVYKTPTYEEDIVTALAISLNIKTKVDIEYISTLSRKDKEEVINELGNRIYLNPTKYNGDKYDGWEMAEEYLSGNVFDKLNYVKTIAEDNDIFNRNVIALKNIQPKYLTASEIEYRLGSNWIPIKYYREFMNNTFSSIKYYRTSLEYTKHNNKWYVANKVNDNTQEYKTKRKSGLEIFEESLNGLIITIKDAVDYIDSNGNSRERYVINANETTIARESQRLLQENFKNWLFSNSERATVLLKIYNETFNTLVPREYDGSHLIFNEMNINRELRQHQKNVVARVIYGGNCLMAHEVGAGKTAAMITAGIYMKRAGIIQKPIYVVPNHLTEQWATEFLKFFPTANILKTTKKDFETNNRNKFVSKIAMGNYDAIIIGQSQFERIPISSERQIHYLNDEISSITNEIQELKKSHDDNWNIKQMVIFQNNLEKKLSELMDEDRKDNLLTFEQLGVDYMFVDEAHNYKNCFIYTKLTNVAGIGQSSSQRSRDMLLKCRYLQEKHNGKGITFATATPISNSMTEMFVMQRYLQPEILKDVNLDNFDSWAAMFGKIESSLEITPDGSNYRMKNRFSKFYNLPELMSMYKLIADIKTSDMLNLPIPKVNNNIIQSICSPIQKDIMNEFIKRSIEIKNHMVDSSQDNMLKITNEAKLMSIDPRLLNDKFPNEEDSKLNLCISKVFEIYEDTEDKKLTQVIFCDSGTPKKDKFNVYDEIKTQLITKGVFSDKIAFIHDAKTDAQRNELFSKVRSGEIRILLGSTGKLGTGTNIQDKLIALHHLDVPWRPSDIVQRDGRAVRQGNTNDTVDIYKYITKGTFDSYLWQIQEQKLKYITQVMTSKSISRGCDDIDETVLTASQIKAIATDNPLLLEKMDIDNEILKITMLKNRWLDNNIELNRKINDYYPKLTKSIKEQIDMIKNDINNIENNNIDNFSINIDNKNFYERAKAGDFLLPFVNSKIQNNINKEFLIGEYRGLKLYCKKNSLLSTEMFIGNSKYNISIEYSGIGTITKIENSINKIVESLEDKTKYLKITNSQNINAKKQVQVEFSREEELQDLLQKQFKINTAIELQTEEKNTNEEINDKDYDMEM